MTRADSRRACRTRAAGSTRHSGPYAHSSMTISKRKHSIRGNLTRIIMLTSTTAVLLTCSAYFVSGLNNYQKRITGDLSATAKMIASNSAAALKRGDRRVVHEVLTSLREKRSVIAAGIYDSRGEPFERYAPNASISIPRTLLPDGFHGTDNGLELFYAINIDGQRVGTLYVLADRRERNERLKQFAKFAAGVSFLSLLIALVLSGWLQGSISNPIRELERVVGLVRQGKDYTRRANHHSTNTSDEISELVTGFNCMLAEIEQRDRQLLMQQTLLEETVSLRTEELRAAKNAAERVAELNARLARESALILNTARDGIMGIGLDNRPTFLNPSGARILGVTLDDFDGRTIHEAVHHSYPDATPWPEVDCPNTLAMRRAEPVGSYDDVFWRPDGTSFPVEYASTPMFDEEGNHLGAVVTFRDVTERRAMERLKGEFVSTVSHELRTPLTSIRGALGLLGSGMLGTVGDKGRRMLEIAVSNTDRLVRLINDILDLERIQSGMVELQRKPVDANALMNQAMDGLQAVADQAGVRLAVLPATATLWGDSDRIIQTLTNLLGNAIKFSSAETTVTLSGVVREDDFVFRVTDEGRGVPQEKLETIFERFSQVDGSDSRDKGGSGLGLAICKSIVDAHGGRIWVEPNEPIGSRFQFTIPLAVSGVMGELPVRGGHTLPFVLLVEDDVDLAKVMTAALQNRGIASAHAVSGREALQRCRQDRPSVIVLDLTLADMDGFAVVAALRESAELAGVPLLVYSAIDVGTTDRARLRLGPTEFLTKSRSSPGDFEEHVVRLLESGLANHAAA
jgi:PAS domain S-box-containing protein